MRDFEYLEPSTLEEASRYALQLGDACRYMAGGTDLLVRMKRRQIQPTHVINLKGIGDLEGIEEFGGTLRIGALLKVAQLEASDIVKGRFPVLVSAAEVMASAQVRNLATVGGNLCNASPSADLAPALLVLGAKVTISSLAGERSLPLEEFFTGPGETVLMPGEILKSIDIPPPRPGARAVYVKYGNRKAHDIAVASAAVSLELGTGGEVKDARVVLGAVAPTPLRVREAETALIGTRAEEPVMARAAKVAARASRPITDVRATAEYRRHMAGVLVKRVLQILIREW